MGGAVRAVYHPLVTLPSAFNKYILLMELSRQTECGNLECFDFGLKVKFLDNVGMLRRKENYHLKDVFPMTSGVTVRIEKRMVF